MLQFYFLSVFLNLLIGFILIYTHDADEDVVEEEVKPAAPKNPDEDISFLDTDWRGTKIVDGSKKKKTNSLFGKGSFLNDALFKLVIGIIAVFTGVIKLLSAVNGVPFFGDLVPAVFGVLGGAAMLLDYYKENSTAELELPALIQVIFVDMKKALGIALVAVAVIHFVLPGVLFL